MRNNLFYYLVLLILVVVDAWLLAHPNLIGQISIFWYDHDYLETLPKAMATVAVTVLVALLISFAGGCAIGHVVCGLSVCHFSDLHPVFYRYVPIDGFRI